MVVREAEPVVVVAIVLLVVLLVDVVALVVVGSGFLFGSTQTAPSASWTHESPT